MEWIKVKDQFPPRETILVWGKCGMPHVAIYKYDAYCHTEHCYEGGFHAGGSDIAFTHWMPLPKPPEE